MAMSNLLRTRSYLACYEFQTWWRRETCDANQSLRVTPTPTLTLTLTLTLPLTLTLTLTLPLTLTLTSPGDGNRRHYPRGHSSFEKPARMVVDMFAYYQTSRANTFD